MPSFHRDQHRFLCTGLSLSSASDTMTPGKWPLLVNVRSYQTGVLQPRFGHKVIYPHSDGPPVHTIARLLDPTGWISPASIVLVGRGDTLAVGHDEDATIETPLITGISGDPLSVLSLQPANSPSPWFFIADSNLMRKADAHLDLYDIGITAPPREPEVVLYTIGINLITTFNNVPTNWVNVGALTSSETSTDPAPDEATRVDTTIADIVYDTDDPNTWATIIPASTKDLGEGMMLLADETDYIHVTMVTPGIADSTIGNIIYDSGSTGWCTVQPTSSIDIGEVDTPDPVPYRIGDPIRFGATKYTATTRGRATPAEPLVHGYPIGPGTAGLPNASVVGAREEALGAPNYTEVYRASTAALRQDTHRHTAQTNFPVGAAVRLGSELVIIRSVSVGPDNILSFRCITVDSHGPGEDITGTSGFRAWIPAHYPVGTRLRDDCLSNIIIPVDPGDPGDPNADPPRDPGPTKPPWHATGGVMSPIDDYNLAQITVGGATRPILPGDDIHLGVKFLNPPDGTIELSAVRIYLDVNDPTDEPGDYPPGGDGGGGGGTGGPGTMPDHSAIVRSVLARYNPVVDWTQSDAAKAQLTRAAAWEIYQVDPHIGLLAKTYGSNVYGYSTDIMIQMTDGSHADAAGATDAAHSPPLAGDTCTVLAQWSNDAPDKNTADTTRWVIPTAEIAAMPGPMTLLSTARAIETTPEVVVKAAAAPAPKSPTPEPSANDFTKNYYFFEWNQSAIVAAIQKSNAANVVTVDQTLYGQPPPPLGRGGNDPNADPTRRANVVPASSAKLPLGENAWFDLTCKVGDLTHVGTDVGRTLKDVKRVEILASVVGPAAETPPPSSGDTGQSIRIYYDSLYISGGFETDIGESDTPYTYRYTYRSTYTGAVSNPSPKSKGGVNPRRQRVICNAEASTDPQADIIDFWRAGGASAVTARGMVYVGSIRPNEDGDTIFNDDYSDTAIADGEAVTYDNFQPWPTTDIPHEGTCTVAGTAVQWASGDKFDTAWAEGSRIIIRERVYVLAQPPLSDTLLFLSKSAGLASDPVPFCLPDAVIPGVPLPVLFGGPIGGVIFTFACGDKYNPGTLLWTKPNSPDMASDRNSLQVSSPSEPLVNGCLYDGLPYVFSTENLYVVEPDFNAPSQFRALVTPCGRGLWCRWGFAVTPQGIAFIAKDGIYLTRGGATAISLTDKDLYPLFPHDGRPGVATGGYAPPAMNDPQNLRLTYVDGWLYFDYAQDTPAHLGATLALRMDEGSWWPDFYSIFEENPSTHNHVTARFWTTGLGQHDVLIGSRRGWVYKPDTTILTDNGDPIQCIARITENQNDARQQKLYRDLAVEMDMGADAVLSIEASLTNQTVILPATAIDATAGRQAYYHPFNATLMDAYGENITLTFNFSPQVWATQAPRFFWYDIGFQYEPELATSWLSGPTTHGLPGYQQIPMALLCYRSFSTATFRILIDNVLYEYTLPSSGGKYFKKFFRLQSVKGLTFQYGFEAPGQAAFQLYDTDCEVWVQPWGTAGNYQKMKPFTGATGRGEGGR